MIGFLGRVNKAEQRIDDNENEVCGIDNHVKQIWQDNKVDYLEYYNKQNNIHTIGMKEGSEGSVFKGFVDRGRIWIPFVC